MTTDADKFDEAGRMVRKERIRDGKREKVKVKVYANKCKKGFRHDPKTGACVKIPAKESRNRSIAAKKSGKKASTKIAKAKSLKRRAALIKK